MPEIQIEGGPQLPPRPGAGQLSVNCSTWSIFEEGDAFGRQWIIRGLRGTDDLITVEIHVSAESIVTMVVEPGVEAGAVDVRGQLLTESDPDAPFIPLQHSPVFDCPRATVFAPVDAASLRYLLGALWQGEEMQLTLLASEREIMEIPLYNDPSYREVFAQLAA
jgi:hypothetical protein